MIKALSGRKAMARLNPGKSVRAHQETIAACEAALGDDSGASSLLAVRAHP